MEKTPLAELKVIQDGNAPPLSSEALKTREFPSGSVKRSPGNVIDAIFPAIKLKS